MEPIFLSEPDQVKVLGEELIERVSETTVFLLLRNQGLIEDFTWGEFIIKQLYVFGRIIVIMFVLIIALPFLCYQCCLQAKEIKEEVIFCSLFTVVQSVFIF